tara:strand:- start:8792 stop:10192 length:1401 start_codon:yes stop_codon:yes gene_type:complete
MTLTNPNRFSTAGTSGTLGHITDAVDFPHSGLIKSLSLGMRGNYAVKTTNGFNITQAGSGNVIQVTSGFVFANGNLFPCDAKNFDASLFTTSPANVSHLLVADVAEAQANRLKIIPHGSNTANRIPDYADGNDVIIAVITYTTGFGSMTVQYLTTDKTSNALSIGYNNSGYDQTMSITGGSGKTTLLSEENQVVLKLNGTGSSNAFQVTDSADQLQFAVTGDGTLTTDLTASRALVTDSSKNITASSVTSTELALLSGAAFGIGNNNILRANANVVDNDFLRVDGTQIEGRSASELASDIGALTGTFGIANNNILQANANLADDDFLRVDGTQIEGRTAAQTLSDIGAMPLAGGIFTGNVAVDSGQSLVCETFTSRRLATVSVSASTTLTEATHAGKYLICAGNVTLPSTSATGLHFTILNTTGGNITVARNGNNINNAASDITVGTFNGVTCIAIGSNNWIALGV